MRQYKTIRASYEAYNIPIVPKEYCIVFDAIPSGLKCLFKGYVYNENVSFKPDIALEGVIITDKRWNNYFIRKLLTEYSPISSRTFWHSKFECIEWKYAWLLPKKYCITNKVREVHFKILHLVYPVKTLFLRFNDDADVRCDFCGTEKEDVVHLFFNCIYSKMFWIELEGLLYKCFGIKVYLFEKDVFFYFNREKLPPNETFVVNLLLIMGKYHIHKQKWAKGKPNFLLFQIDMKHYVELLLGLKNNKAKRTRSLCEAFTLFV